MTRPTARELAVSAARLLDNAIDGPDGEAEPDRLWAQTEALVAIALALTDPKPREPQVRKL